VFDARTRKLTHRLRVGKKPKGIAFSPDERLAFVTNWRGRSVSVIDVARKRVIRQIVEEYAWGAPDELLAQLRAQLAE
jgi:YVTN family beta-propeller protein